MFRFQEDGGALCDIALCGSCVSPIYIPTPKRKPAPTWHERIMADDTV